MKAKVGKVIWFNTMVGSIGIVAYQRGGKKFVRVGQISGADEEQDIQTVIDWGVEIKEKDLEELVKHFESLEPKEGETECKICGKKFLSTEILKEHFKTKHSEECSED